MIYPEEFKQKVLEACNNNEFVNYLLESGDYRIGQALSESSEMHVTPETIINAYENKDFTELYREALKRKKFGILYLEWKDIKDKEKQTGMKK